MNNSRLLSRFAGASALLLCSLSSASGPTGYPQPPMPQGMQPMPQGMQPMPQGMQPMPQGMQPMPQGMQPMPQGMQPMPQGMQPMPQGMKPMPQGMRPMPQGMKPMPQGMKPMPQGMQPMPQGMKPMPPQPSMPALNGQPPSGAAPAQSGGSPDTKQGAAAKPLDEVKKLLQDAFRSSQAGDSQASRASLQQARQWMDKFAATGKDASAKAEATRLAGEIESLEQSLGQNAADEQTTISRLWHRTTSLVQREVDSLIHSYKELSSTDKSLKSLLDAKMHLRNAEHSLFVVYMPHYADSQLGTAVNNLEEAKAGVKPGEAAAIDGLIADLKALGSGAMGEPQAVKENNVADALARVMTDLLEARNAASDSERTSLDRLIGEVKRFQDEVLQRSVKARYDASLAKLRALIEQL